MKQAKWPPKWCCWFCESTRRADDEKLQVHKVVAMAFNSHITVSGFSALDWSLRLNYKIIYSKCCLSFQQSLVINDRECITHPRCVPVDEQRLNSDILKCWLFFFFNCHLSLLTYICNSKAWGGVWRPDSEALSS